MTGPERFSQYRLPLSLAPAVACLLLGTVLVPEVGAQMPRSRPGRFEVHGLDFRPDGAWRKRVGVVRERRRELLRAGAVAALNLRAPTAVGGARVSGLFHVPVVPVAFANRPAPFAVSAYQHLLFNGNDAGPYSLKTYYEQISDGNITLSGRVFGWSEAPEIDTYYEEGCNGVGVDVRCPSGGARLGELLVFALDHISTGSDSLTVWAEFDNDGPDGLPNSGDDDGFVDFVTFLQPELDGACGNANVWAHRWVVSAVNGGSPYVTRTPSRSGGMLKVQDYTMQSAVGGDNACTGGKLMPIGTVAHETGHAFGLPDLYDTDPESGTEGIGEWGLMGSGNYARPYSPARYDAWSLVELGWVAVDTLASSRTVELGPVSASDSVLLVRLPNADEYFLIENRQALGSDTAQMNPAWASSRVKRPGLLIWHVDQARVRARSRDNTVNSGPAQGVVLIQADGLNELLTANARNRGDAGDPFPGRSDNRRFSLDTRPAAVDNVGAFAGFTIDSIVELTPGTPGPIRFRFRRQQQLHWTVTGPGSVSTGTAALRSGDPVDLDSLVTLTAVPQSGALFLGWTGDTTAQGRELVLRAERSWRVTAAFASGGQVGLQQAADGLLGIASLTADQRGFLDALGNRNGTYDLGDFLALVASTGAEPDSELVRRVLVAEVPR